MGIDLTLAPIKNAHGSWWLAYDRLRLDRYYDLYREFGMDGYTSISVYDVIVNQFDWYDDEGIVSDKLDPYGEKLKYFFSDEISKIDVNQLELSTWNKAVIEFIKSLPKQTPVVLYWH